MLHRITILRLTLYLVAGFAVFVALLAYFSRDNLFRFFLDPRIPFQTYQPPAAPDYADPASWVRGPTSDQDKNDTHVFVVTPTTYWGGEQWNTPLDDAQSSDRLIRDAVPNWAGPFRKVGHVAIPRYRAASLYSFLTIRNDAKAARAFAYADVLAAFDRFFADIDGKGPIVLVGVEQGGLHVLGLLQDRFDNPHMRERLAVAYVIDFAVPLDLFDDGLRGLSPCKEPQSTRCIVSYGAFTEKDVQEITRFRERSMVWDQKGRLQNTHGRTLTCVNPVLGSANSDFAPPRLHLGGAAATGLDWGTEPAPIPEQTSTQCEDGILLIDPVKSKSFRKKRSLGARFKPDTYNLFYANLSKDAEQRTEALRQRFQSEGRLAPPFGGVIELKQSPINKTPDADE
ncbi:FIG00480936: hypothetical protein [hydrothermal vent metagenome]|uniref:DUF3089 domain-containing protein n=1 Tax=hydrothermal vent metagenome TaxID=652676 RepID=A0A3B0RCV4_9ZZZZ